MIVGGVSKPTNTIFYLSAYILKYAKKMRWYTIEDLYGEVLKHINLKFKIFIYCMDFLYLCGVVEYKKEENVYVYRIINH